MRPYADNVWLKLEPLEKATPSGIVLVEGDRKTKGTRKATVMASGAGYVTKLGAFVENTVREGQTVYVYALAGQDWSRDFDAPRHNGKIEFDQALGERADIRVVRESEILAFDGPDGKPQAMAGYAIVRRSEAAKQTPGGIHIPEDHAPRPLTGTVLSVGPGRARENGKRFPIDVQVSDVVMFGRFQGTDLEVRGETLTVLREDEILAVTEAAEAVEAA